MSTPDHATIEFLRWVSARTATYKEAWEVWQTTCPRHPTWEDAFIGRLVSVERRSDVAEPIVVLTPLGRSIVERGAGDPGATFGIDI